ncbi:MAG: phosphotransferase [Candidatus Aenigmarchaeota archaeon]|nr:phosphotransferase [Candidatus Aenigmarchaeota archaeon]
MREYIVAGDILKRVDLQVPLKSALEKVSEAYRIGNVLHYRIIQMGFEDANIVLETKKGKYVLKIFSKLKTLRKINDVVKGLVEFRKAGVPTPKLLKARGKYLLKIGKSYMCLMEFFTGKSFEGRSVSEKELNNIVKFMAKIHGLRFKVKHNYDSWGTVNLVKEYREKKRFLREKDRKLVEPAVREFGKINFSKFRKSIIHGDLQRHHFLKNSKGDMCIIDLGCMDYNASVLDLAIFLALFFPVNSVGKCRKIYYFVLEKYNSIRKLTKEETEAIPILIQATYAIYLIASTYNKSPYWIEFARKGLGVSRKLWKDGTILDSPKL